MACHASYQIRLSLWYRLWRRLPGNVRRNNEDFRRLRTTWEEAIRLVLKQR